MTGCGQPKVKILPDDRLVEFVPAGHCADCHADYYDGRAVLSPGYLLEIFRQLEDK